MFFLLTVTRHLNYPSYQFNVLRLIIFSRKFNVYFALSKEYVLKVNAVSSNATVRGKRTNTHERQFVSILLYSMLTDWPLTSDLFS